MIQSEPGKRDNNVNNVLKIRFLVRTLKFREKQRASTLVLHHTIGVTSAQMLGMPKLQGISL